jgi:spore coat polysaccharide biosynthesis protein SpsF
MQKVAVIVQARLGSTRLPAKVLLPLPTGIMTLCGERFVPAATVLEEVVNRCIMIDGVDVVVAAIPDTPENDILVDILNRGQEERQEFDGDPPLKIVRGPEHDVLARYARAAEAVKADVIMRITADCPLIDPEVCGLVLAASRPVDYCSNVWPRTYPQGLDCEVFTRDLLRRAVSEDHDYKDSSAEHVTTWMAKGQGIRRANVFDREDRSHLRWTLDTLDDYKVIWSVMQQQMREAA